MLVYVQAQNGKPLMPTSRCGAVRHWLKEGRAKVVRREPFTIRLLDRAEGYTQELRAGVDLGTAHVGVSVISAKEELFAGEFRLRTDISKLLTERRQFRQNRRSRKCRHRACRFLNRRRRDDLAPSMRAKVRETLRVVRLTESILPIRSWTFEAGGFDLRKIVGCGMEGVGYRRGTQHGFANVREYVLWRDRHTCIRCHGKSGDPRLVVHHVRPRKNGGSDRTANLVTLCSTCHRRQHNGQPLDLRPPQSVRDATQFNVVKTRVLQETTRLRRSVTFGYITKTRRSELGLPKSHLNDAFVIAGGGRQSRFATTYLGMFFRRQNRKLYKGVRSHIRNTIPHSHGFHRGDRVRHRGGQEGFVWGLRSSGRFEVRRLDGTVIGHSLSWRTLYRLEGARTLRIERVTTEKGGMAASCCR